MVWSEAITIWSVNCDCVCAFSSASLATIWMGSSLGNGVSSICGAVVVNGICSFLSRSSRLFELDARIIGVFTKNGYMG